MFRYSGKKQPSNDVHFLDFGDNEGPGDPNLVDQGEHPYFCALYVDFGTSFPFIGKKEKKKNKQTGRIKERGKKKRQKKKCTYYITTHKL